MSRSWILVGWLAGAGVGGTALGADLLYNTGEPQPVTDIATLALVDGGYISGYYTVDLPMRYTATAFTIEQDIAIEEVVVYWFDNSDNTTLPPVSQYEWTIHADDVGGGPGTIVDSGLFNQAAITDEDWTEPVGGLLTDWKRRFALVTELDAGTYWISFHGINGSIAWLTGAADGSDIMYRATVGTDYTLYTNTVWETADDPARVYHVAFEVYGTVIVEEPVCEGDANADNVVDPLDSGYVLSRFGCSVGTGDPACDAADVNLDGIVDPLDSGFVLSRFGDCPVGFNGGDEPSVKQPRRQVVIPTNDEPSETVNSVQ